MPSYCLSGLSKLCHIWKQKRNEISFHKIGREDFMIYDVIFIKRFSPLLVQYSYIVQFSTFIYLFICWHHIVESNTKSCIYSIVRIWSYRFPAKYGKNNATNKNFSFDWISEITGNSSVQQMLQSCRRFLSFTDKYIYS